MNKPDHPKFSHWMDLTKMKIAVFAVGYYEPVPRHVVEATQRIGTALVNLGDDIALLREWEGNIVYYAARNRLINPDITDEMIQQCIDATLKVNPGWEHDASWRNSTHGVSGISVRIKPA